MCLLLLFSLSVCPVSAEVATSHHLHMDQGQQSFESMVVQFEEFLQTRLDRQPLPHEETSTYIKRIGGDIKVLVQRGENLKVPSALLKIDPSTFESLAQEIKRCPVNI